MMELRHLGLAVAYRKIGIVAIESGQLKYWKVAKHAYGDLDKLKKLINDLIDSYNADVVVTERTGVGCKKGDEAQRHIAAIGELARNRKRLVMEMPRTHDFANKYEEAAELAKHYPDLLPQVVEKVPCWKNEPRRMIMFEALALTDAVLHLPPERLAAAMG